MDNYKKFIFNFSSSYSGGGLKRLNAFSYWFNNNGGARFIVNDRLKSNMEHFKNNIYHYVNLNRIQKTLNLQKYVETIIDEIDGCLFYYSYNIPMKQFKTKLSWFHLSNVLPLMPLKNFYIPIPRQIELYWLGFLIKRGLNNCNFISAESKNSMKLISFFSQNISYLSANGSDDELKMISKFKSSNKFDNIAVLFGTYYHKNLVDSFKIFKYLQSQNKEMHLHIFGDTTTIPIEIKADPKVIIEGMQERSSIINLLRRASFYINTSLVENSWNAAAEGIFLAKESFISDIPAHRELISGFNYENLNIMDTVVPILRLKNEKLKTNHLTTWDDEIRKIVKIVKKNLASNYIISNIES